MKLHCPSCRNLFDLPSSADMHVLKLNCPICHTEIPTSVKASVREQLGYVPFSLAVIAACGQFLVLVAATLFRLNEDSVGSNT